MFMAAAHFLVTIAILLVNNHAAEFCDDVRADNDAILYDLYQGNLMKLDCQVSPNGGTGIAWFHTPVKSNASSSYPFPFCGNNNCLLLNNNSTLIIKDTGTDAKGTFACLAACTKSGLKKWRIIVHECEYKKPSISGPDKVVSRKGEEVTMYCKANYICDYFMQEPGVIWQWNGSLLENGTDGVRKSTVSSENGAVYTSTLVISKVKEEHFRFPFVCSPEDFLSKETSNHTISLFSQEITSEPVNAMYFLPGVIGAIVIVVIVGIIIFIALVPCGPQVRMKKRQITRKLRKRKEKYRECYMRDYDVFIYHDETHNKEAVDVSSYLQQKGFWIQCGRPEGTPHSAVRDIIENSRSVVCISNGDELLQSVLKEATEEIRSHIVIIYTDNSEKINTATVNAVCLQYRVPGESCYPWNRNRFLINLLLALPNPNNSKHTKQRPTTTNRQTSSIALISTQQSVCSQSSQSSRV